MGELVALGIKLAIRTDRETGVVRAYIASLDGVTLKQELGSVTYGALDGIHGQLFRRWMDVMRDCAISIIADAIGKDAADKLEWSGDIDPGDLESAPQG